MELYIIWYYCTKWFQITEAFHIRGANRAWAIFGSKGFSNTKCWESVQKETSAYLPYNHKGTRVSVKSFQYFSLKIKNFTQNSIFVFMAFLKKTLHVHFINFQVLIDVKSYEGKKVQRHENVFFNDVLILERIRNFHGELYRWLNGRFQ